MDQAITKSTKNAQVCMQLCTYVMCGGGGTRLWPLSRADNPKQHLRLSSNQTMLEETIARIQQADVPGVVTNVNLMGAASQIDAMRTAMPKGVTSGMPNSGMLIAEPFGKNTAPAVAVASLHAVRSDDDPYVLILPSDHVIQPVESFTHSLSQGLEAADDGQIVVFGIEPTGPVTGYGYIEVDDVSPVSKVKSFREKPDLETAKDYVQSGRHLWNAGIFLFRASTMLAALKEFAPEILSKSQHTLEASPVDDNTIALHAGLFETVPADSIDFAVMEHAKNVTMVRASFDWHDVGSFASLVNIGHRSKEMENDIVTLDCTSSLLHSEGPLIAAIGVKDLAIVSTPDATLVAPLDRAEDIKKLIAELETRGRDELKQTPWLPEQGANPGDMKASLLSWLEQTALPFWAAHGVDEKYGGFHEVLDFSGNSTNANKRLRTMARQTYVFAKAVEMGLGETYEAAVLHGLNFLESSPAAPLGGWFKTFDATCKPIDKTEDLYDHAFVLLALAQVRKSKLGSVDGLMKRLMTTVDGLLVESSQGHFLGYGEDAAHTLPRRANPHMHLLEAFLAWYEASGDTSYLERAGQITELFENHFYDHQNLILGESFDANLQFSAGNPTDFEPGHHFEWSHLLQRYAEYSGTNPSNAINGLVASAQAYGINPVSGLAYDLVSFDGKPAHLTSRCWVQTERLTSLVVLSANGKEHLAYAAERCARQIWKTNLKSAPQGMWIDVVDTQGGPATDTVPASTLYHLIGCIDTYTKHIV